MEQNLTNLDQPKSDKSKSESKSITNKADVPQGSVLKSPEMNRLEPPQIESDPHIKQNHTNEPKEQELIDPFAPVNR